jgi:hypothetical protein
MAVLIGTDPLMKASPDATERPAPKGGPLTCVPASGYECAGPK